MADSYINGHVNSGSQQQWMFRNNHFESYDKVLSGWNFVFVGNENAPDSNCVADGYHYTTSPATPRIAEKPYIALNYVDQTKFDLVIP